MEFYPEAGSAECAVGEELDRGCGAHEPHLGVPPLIPAGPTERLFPIGTPIEGGTGGVGDGGVRLQDPAGDSREGLRVRGHREGVRVGDGDERLRSCGDREEEGDGANEAQDGGQ